MKKGGYKIIDFKGTALSGTAVEMSGIYEQIVDDYDKPIMVSGVILNGKLQDAAYASVIETEDSVKLTVYSGVITVTEDNEVSFTSSVINNGDILIAESGTNDKTWGNKLAALQNAYEGLSDYQKRHAYLLISNVISISYYSGLFGKISFSDSRPAVSWYDIVNHKYIRISFSSSVNTYDDYSNNESPTVIYLYAPKERQVLK